MKIDYILSDTTKKATSMALSTLVSKAEQDPLKNFIVLVPETKSIIIEKELLALSKTGAFVNVFVYSFVRLINRMGLVSEEQIASKQTAVMMIRKIIYENFDKLVCYKKTAKTTGFAEKIYNTIAQLKSSNVSPDDLKMSLATSNEALKQKLQDLSLIYDAYEKALSDGLYDDCDKLALIEKYAKSVDFIKKSNIYVVGFDNITFEMQSVLKELAVQAESITFSSVFFSEGRADKYIQKNELYKKFARIGDDLKFPYIPKSFKTYSSGDFYNIENYLFSPEKKQFKSNGNVQIFEAKTETDEIEFVASTILKGVSGGKRFRDFGVFVSSLDSSINEIEEIFKSHKIPYFVNKSHDLSSHFYVRFLRDIFSSVSSNYSAENVLSVISNPLFDSKDYSAVLLFANESGINYSAFLKENLSETYGAIESLKAAEDDLKKFQVFATKFKENYKKVSNVRDYVRLIEFVNEYFGVKLKLLTCADFERKNSLEIEAEITEKIFEKIEKYNKIVENFMGTLEVGFDEFLQIYYSGLDTIKINLLPVSIDTVVVQADTDGFFDIKELFVVGAVEGKFPARIQDSGMILDSELEETKKMSGKVVEPSVKEINARENFRVFEALLEPKEKLYVSYCLKDCSGTQNKPSRIVLRLISLFGKEILKKNFEKFDCSSREAIEKEFAKKIGKFLDGEETNANLNEDYGKLGGKLGNELSAFLNSSKFVGENFELDEARKLYFRGNKTSVSQLEKYFACPYQFFATYGLRLKENKTAKLSGLDVGLVVHTVAELFVKNIDEFEGLNAETFESKVLKLLEKALIQNKIVGEKNGALLKLLESESVRLCRYLMYERQNSGFKTMKNGTEFVFAGENAVKIPLENGKTISLEGKIDRIDSWGDYIRIIDYKTGDVSSDISSVYFGKKIQLVSYLSAVCNLNGKKVAGLFYLPIHSDFAKLDKKPKNMFKFEGFLLDDIDVVKNMDFNLSFENPESNFVALKIKTSAKNRTENIFEISGSSNKNLSQDEFENIKNYTEKLCMKAVQEIESGFIEPSPMLSSATEDTPSICSWCKYAGVCGLENAKFSGGRSLNFSVSSESFDLSNLSGEENGNQRN
jgi:ATP-dependent helicase/nuclease subunit B